MRLAEDVVEPGVGPGHGVEPPRAADERFLHPERGRPRADEREDLHQVAHVLRGDLSYKMPHRGRLELVHADGVTRSEEPLREEVALGEGLGVHALAAPGREAHRLGDRAERAVAEEVELDEPHRLDAVLVVLRDDDALRRALERRVAGDAVRRYHDAPAVEREVVREALEPLREAEGEFHPLGLDGERPPLLPREAPDEPLHDLGRRLDRHAERLRDLAEGEPRLHRRVRRDHRDMAIAMLLVDVVDDRVAEPPAEVDVEIGEVGSALIEKPLEREVVLDRVDVRDAE